MRVAICVSSRPYAAGSGMHQGGIAGLERIGGEGEIMRRHALQQGCSRVLHAEARRNFDQLRGGNQRVLGIAADDAGGDDRIAGGKSRNAGPELLHRARGFAAGDHGQRGFVDALAEVDLDEVDAGGFNAHQDLARSRFGDGQIGQLQNFGSASRMNLDGFHDCDKDEP